MIADRPSPSPSPLFPRGVSEWREATGHDAPAWEPFLRLLRESTAGQRRDWRESIRRELREDGLNFTLSPEFRPEHRREDLDPVPWIFSALEWRGLETGIAQRARLLEAVTADLCGPRLLIRRGLLPPELVFTDPVYLRPAIDLPTNFGARLFQVAMDLVRGPDGNFRVLRDRSESPVGGGYALECRTILGRVFPRALSQMRVRRLAPYFRNLRESMLTLYQGRHLEPRVVLMSPGPFSPAYFEHAYLAAYLGYTLVQGDDLLVRGGALKLKTLEGLQPVEILLRMVDAAWLDPLELRRDSVIGVPGLLGAARANRLAILNHPGCGLLENRGLLPFLPGLCRELLGEELRLHAVNTWWCGQTREREYVLEHLQELLLSPLHPSRAEPTIDGRRCTAAELEALRGKILRNPLGYVGQEPVEPSQLPTLFEEGLRPRPATLRAFAAATPGGDFQVMPGGLARTPGSPEEPERLKDVWVLGENPEPHQTLWPDPASEQRQTWFSGVFTSRSAENLFWVGRYAERLSRQTRLLRGLAQLRESTASAGEPGPEDFPRLLTLLGHVSCLPELPPDTPDADRIIRCLRDGGPGGSLRRNLQSLLLAAYSVRDIWSQDSWRSLTAVEQSGEACCREGKDPLEMENELNLLMLNLNAFHGLNANGMTRESGWSMLMLGRVVESGVGLCQLIGHLLTDETNAVPYSRMEIALQQNENLITYRRHYRTTPQLRSVLELMCSSEINPRSLVFHLEQFNLHLAQLPPPVKPDALQPLVLRIKQLRATLLRERGLPPAPDGGFVLPPEIPGVFEQGSDQLASAYFNHVPLRVRENF